jgi:ubiquinone/menaquinone biosynthesis C-methylase UbiE
VDDANGLNILRHYTHQKESAFWKASLLSQPGTNDERYWDRVAEDSRNKDNVKMTKDWIALKNWVAEYANGKVKDLLLKTYEGFISLPRAARVLDVGCGSGKWARMYAEKGYTTTGIDASSGMIRLAKAGKINVEKVNFGVMDVSSLGFEDASFELVNCVTVLQHITFDEKWKKAVKEIVRVTKPNSSILLYEVAPMLPLSRGMQSVCVRTSKEYQFEFRKAGARLVFSIPTDISFLLTLFFLRKYSTTFASDEAYFYWAGRKSRMPWAHIKSLSSKIIAGVARRVDYGLAGTPLGIISPLRIMLFKKAR